MLCLDMNNSNYEKQAQFGSDFLVFDGELMPQKIVST
jgi:hypothetical protein